MIILATLNAKYIHCSLGLRLLLANMGPLRPQTLLKEFTLETPASKIAEQLLKQSPKIVGLGVYIWNITQTTELVRLIKRASPTTKVILGGPEISYEYEGTELYNLADHIVRGEAEIAFQQLCADLLAGKTQPKVLTPPITALDALASPANEYSDDDLKNRLIYLESSRGCPFGCEFCLSSLTPSVREYPIEPFLQSLDHLIARGARRFKFVDRTFNLNEKTATRILEHVLHHAENGIFFHFEIVPDRLEESLLNLASRFPAGTLQFEVGIQTFNTEIAHRINRRQNLDKTISNMTFLRQKTSVHLHADLIVGLPGETLESFGAGFDRLVELAPHEIQVGILKRLKGAPISRHCDEWELVFSQTPPYEIVSSRTLDRTAVTQMVRFAKYWELLFNRAELRDSLALLRQPNSSPFASFLAFSQWLYDRLGKTHGIPLHILVDSLAAYLELEKHLPRTTITEALSREYHRVQGRKIPSSLKQ